MQEDYSKIQNFKLLGIPPDNSRVYLIKQRSLGQGQFANTYLATLKDNESQTYACKIIEKKKLIEKLINSQDPEKKKQFILKSLQNEVSVWQKLQHPNIVQFYDFAETQNNYYFIMEWCQGGDLESLKQKYGQLQELQAMKLFQQLVDGCKYLYDMGVYHRDLKPANVLIHNNVGKIADFGFCKMLEDNKEVAALQTAVGTPYYMAPQILGGVKYSIKCDVWSLGVLFYDILCGMLPWQISPQMLPEQLLQLIIYSQPIQFPKNCVISQDVKLLISKMLTIKEEDRLSMPEVQIAVNNYFNNQQQQMTFE